MSVIASQGQLRMSYLRWALFTVPGVLLLGFMSGVLSGSGVGNPWFDGLTKPSLYPDPRVFGIAWSILYVLMGLAVAIVLSARGARLRGTAVAAFVLQLILNLAWSPTFFGAHQLALALGVIVAMDVAVIVTVWLFWKVRPLAALLMLPYLAWILFATVLNWQFLQSNPGADGRMGAAPVERVEF